METQMIRCRSTVLQILTCLVVVGAAGAADYGVSPTNLAHLLALVRPQADESKWREIPWLTDLGEARRQAATEGKPILIWSAGGSPPIGGC